MWEDPEIYQIWTRNQAKQDDWLKETQKKCPVKGIQTSVRARLSLSRPPMPLSTRYSFSSIRKVLIKHFTSFTTFCLYVEIHFYIAAGPGPCHWALVPWGLVARIQRSHCRGLTSISSQQPKPCFKLLQAKGTWDYQIQIKLRTNGKVEKN